MFAVEDGRVRLRPVRTGASGASGAAVEVLDGLEPGTLVVLHPGERLVDGARVQAVGPDR